MISINPKSGDKKNPQGIGEEIWKNPSLFKA